MKEIIILSLLSTASVLSAYSQKTERDTMSIIINGEKISMPVPATGHKTTVNLEDSASVIQISIGKSAKGITALSSTSLKEDKSKNKRVNWLGHAELGLTTLTAQRTINSPDTAYENRIFTSISPVAYMVNLTPKTIQSGFNIGFSLRERRRTLGKSNLVFVTGTHLRYSRLGYKGTYDVRRIKAVTSSNGNTVFYPDSVYSTKTGSYKAIINSYQLLFPFLIEGHLKNKDITISAGLNLGINLVSTKNSPEFNTDYSIPYFSTQQNIDINFQPVIRAFYKRTGVFLSIDPGKTMLGYGSSKAVKGNFLYFGVSYKLY